MRWLIGLTGFVLGVISCALLAVVEYGAWALVLPPRLSREPPDAADDPIDTCASDDRGDRGISISALALEPVLWGRSMGAAIALRAAAENPVVRALVLESPMVDLDEAVAVWLRKRRLPFPRPLARLITRRAGRLAGVSLTRPRALD